VTVALVAYPAEPQIRQLLTDLEVDPGYLVCGLAASLHSWRPAQFARFLAWHGGGRDGEPALPLRCDHAAVRPMSHGVEAADVGRCLRFASVAASGTFPGGLLVLGVLAEPWAEGIAAAMAGGQWRAMSVGGVTYDADLWTAEVSLVAKAGDQADEGALVIESGPGAARCWELLTGQPAAGPV
jgi:hypothetical protein